MTEAGFPMHQTTVAKIESATRPTRLDELVALTSLFGVEVCDLLAETTATRDAEKAMLTAMLTAAQQEVERQLNEAGQRMHVLDERLAVVRGGAPELAETVRNRAERARQGRESDQP